MEKGIDVKIRCRKIPKVKGAIEAVWAITPYINHGFIIKDGEYQITHIKSGLAIAKRPLNVEEAFSLFKMLVSKYNNFGSDLYFNSSPKRIYSKFTNTMNQMRLDIDSISKTILKGD